MYIPQLPLEITHTIPHRIFYDQLMEERLRAEGKWVSPPTSPKQGGGPPLKDEIAYASARMKLILPRPPKKSEDEQIQKLITTYKFEYNKGKVIRFLKEILAKHEFTIESETDDINVDVEVDSGLEQSVYTLSLKVGSDQFDTKLLTFLRAFYRAVAKRKDFIDFPSMKPQLIVNSNEAFSQTIVPYAEEKLRAFFWGNIQNGVYFNHWEVSTTKEDSNMKPRVLFEFDRKDMIIIKMIIWEQKKTRDSGRERIKRDYKLTILKDWIRRIIVDLAVSNSSEVIEDQVQIHFELNCPPKIENADHSINPPKFNRVTTIKHGRCENKYPKDSELANCPFFTLEFEKGLQYFDLYTILSRLKMRTGLPIEFSTFKMVDYLIGAILPYFNWKANNRYTSPTDAEDETFCAFLSHYLPIDSENLSSSDRKDIKKKRFIITYMIECLLSRGAKFKDQICLEKAKWTNFLCIIGNIIKRSHGEISMAERCLERLTILLDENKQIGNISDTLSNLYEVIKREEANPIAPSEEENREGYQRVRKVIITPTRTIYVVPEMMMSNRVLRRFDPDGYIILRVSFRDDDNQKMMLNKTGKFNIDRAVRDKLINGITIANVEYGYLGSSNSQLRDHGSYFMPKMTAKDIRIWRRQSEENYNKLPPEDLIWQIEFVRDRLGKFTEIESVPKMMARLGQCFTQSRLSGVPLPVENLARIHDIIGSENTQGTVFTFSDGVGCVSKEFAKKMAIDFGFKKSVPSCFQIRYRGLKGVLGVNNLLDEHNQWVANQPNIGPPPQKFLTSWTIHVGIRESQDKFYGARQEYIEIVKVSSPSPVALNKPFINILDQVSQMQGPDVHKRMTKRIEELLDRQMRGFAKEMIDETQCRSKLKELPRRIDIDKLSLAAGFEMSNEIFFRSLIKASVRYSVTRQLRKAQIQIPTNCGRTLLGIIDETSRLQYGQVFVQVTNNVLNKHLSENASKKVIRGTVLMTKNPCIVPGDVRIFEAVDIPELNHLVDVVVFPQHGPRPHPDEMAGSDLDGDEYCVIWDKEMLLTRNEEPFDFSASKRIDLGIKENLQTKMANFYVDYMTLDAVGSISNAHLAASDQYGINHRVCMDLAKKNSQALDFTKSGQCPAELRKTWLKIEETGEELPPEKAERNPDFQLSSNKPMYQSPRLLGKLYREIKTIEDVMRIGEERDEQFPIKLDKYLEVEGWKTFKETAEKELIKFISQFQAIMENYGIRSEAELFTGCITDIRNRLSDKEADDMSFFNTNNLIETKVTNICKKIREQFFDDFGGWNAATQVLDKPFAEDSNIFHREAKYITLAMKQKASAYYICCYTRAQETGERFLAFPWLLYEILAIIKQEKIIGLDTLPLIGNPLFQLLETRMDQYIDENSEKFRKFVQFKLGPRLNKAINVIKKYCRKYDGLDRLLFIVYEWGNYLNIKNSQFTTIHLLLVAIMCLINGFASLDGDGNRTIEPIPVATEIEDLEPEPFGGLSKLLVKFFEFLASRKFARLTSLSFDPLRIVSCFSRGEWLPYHRAGMSTFYNMVYNLRFEELPLKSDSLQLKAENLREMEPFAIELPEDIADLNELRDKLCEKARVKDVTLRRIAKSRIVMVSARGTLQSLDQLKSLVTVMPSVNLSGQGKDFQRKIFRMVFEKIQRDELVEEDDQSKPDIWED